MSYRTYINGNEWLGNNECPKIIMDELKRQGCPFDGDCCCKNGFEIKDLNGLVMATEKWIISKCKNNQEVANFNSTIEQYKDCCLTENLKQLQDCAYIFVSVNLLKYVGGIQNYTREFKQIGKDKYNYEYKLKPGVKCLFEAY